MAARLDVVIPTFDNVAELRRCLDGMQPGMPIDRVLVCVDGSTDATLEYLAGLTLPFPLAVLEHPDRRNHGRSATRNLALTHLTAQHVLLLDSDMRLDPDAADRHLDVLVGESNAISVGDVVYLNAVENLWARYLGTRGKNKYRPGVAIRPLDFTTANTALRTADLLASGGFDESLVGYGGEDTELALRLGSLGRWFVFNAAARSTTFEAKSVDQGLAQLHAYGRTNLGITRKRHPDGPAPFWIDRYESNRMRDRIFRSLLNPLTDRVVDLALPRVPFAVQRRFLDYKVIRAVFAGYAEGVS